MQEQLYGRAGQATANYINAPSRFQSKNTRWEFNVDKANQVLDQAGWKRGADGIRAKDGKRLKLLLQTSINPLRQKEQAIIKQGAAKAGIEMELKTVVASVFFGSDEANPDNLGHFTADLQMYAWQFDVDPQPSMRVFPSWEVATKENKFSGRNTTRWRNEEFDRPVQGGRDRDGPGQAGGPLHPDERPRRAEHGRHPARLAELGLGRRRTS